jgi:prepilin-type N-terminal cleavage/methylation domain-containing protein
MADSAKLKLKQTPITYKYGIEMNKEHGFGLVELITTMAILAIVAATAVPNFSAWRNNYQIRSESERVHMDLLLARTTAIKNNNNVVVTFLPSTNAYSILSDTNGNGTADTGERLRSRTLENNVVFGFNGSSMIDMENNTGITETVKMGPSDIVTFDARGQASVSGVLFLIHANHLPTTNEKLRGISVIQATGAAELWNYDVSLSPPWL